MLQSKRLMQFR